MNFYMEIWEELLQKAIKIIKSSGIPQNVNNRFFWSFGGGTVMMLDYGHRLSRDIDIFLADSQLLGYFSPRVNSTAEFEADQYREQPEYIKLRTQKGNIDFIVAQKLTNVPHRILHMFDTDIPCESPMEIIAKKVVYRHDNFMLRDYFDLATMIKNLVEEQDKKALHEIIEPYVEILSKRFEMTPQSFSDTSLILPLPKGEEIVKEGEEILVKYFKHFLQH